VGAIAKKKKTPPPAKRSVGCGPTRPAKKRPPWVLGARCAVLDIALRAGLRILPRRSGLPSQGTSAHGPGEGHHHTRHRARGKKTRMVPAPPAGAANSSPIILATFLPIRVGSAPEAGIRLAARKRAGAIATHHPTRGWPSGLLRAHSTCRKTATPLWRRQSFATHTSGRDGRRLRSIGNFSAMRSLWRPQPSLQTAIDADRSCRSTQRPFSWRH